MKDVLNILKSAWEKHNILGTMDLRITMSKKGIKVNLGLGSNSNKPSSFDLSQAVLDSCEISLSWVERILINHNNNVYPDQQKQKTSWILECIKRKEMLEEVISELKKS